MQPLLLRLGLRRLGSLACCPSRIGSRIVHRALRNGALAEPDTIVLGECGRGGNDQRSRDDDPSFHS